MASVQIFEHNVKGRYFVSGLFWQPLPGMTPSARKTAIEKLAKEQDFDLMVLRTHGAPQVGFCSMKEAGRPGMLSAAAIVSKTVEVEGRNRNLLCATKISKDLWLYVAQREGVILHDGDQVGTEDQIRSRMLTDISASDWETIFAPSHWNIRGSEERLFESFLPKKGSKVDLKKWWGLRPIKTNFFGSLRAYWPLLLATALILGGASGYWYWSKKKAERELAEFLAQQAAADQAMAAKAQRMEHPWKTAPRATGFAEACEAGKAKVKNLFPGNWTFNDTTCAGGVLTVSWTRLDEGTVAQIREIEPRVTIFANGNSASLNLPVTMPAGEDEKLPLQRERELEMYNVSQVYGIRLALTEPPAPAVLPGQQNKPQVIKDWKEVGWAIKDANLPPPILIGLFEGKGLRVNRIQTKIVDGVMSWNLEGVQYVQP